MSLQTLEYDQSIITNRQNPQVFGLMAEPIPQGCSGLTRDLFRKDIGEASRRDYFVVNVMEPDGDGLLRLPMKVAGDGVTDVRFQKVDRIRVRDYRMAESRRGVASFRVLLDQENYFAHRVQFRIFNLSFVIFLEAFPKPKSPSF